jgi:hypothetical protein
LADTARQYQNARAVPLLAKYFGNAQLRQIVEFEMGMALP